MRVEKVYISENGTRLSMGTGVIIEGTILAADCETTLVDAKEDFVAYSTEELLDALGINLSELAAYVAKKTPTPRGGTIFGGNDGK